MIYVYLHIIPSTKQVFYVGIGQDNRAWSKIGRNNLWKDIVNENGYEIIIYKDKLTENEAEALEKQLIQHYGRIGYESNGILVNKSIGGYKKNSGTKKSPEAKQKISIGNKGISRNKGKTYSEEHKQKISQSKKGWIPSKERGIKIGSKTKGRIQTIQEREKRSLSAKLLYKPIIQYDLEGNFIKEWENITQAKKWLGKGDINSCLSNRQSTAGGYKWKYKND
jgi:hypothetical protein